MKTFKAITKTASIDPFVDWYEGETEADARAVWSEDCHRCGLPMDRTTVEFVECDPVTLKPCAR